MNFLRSLIFNPLWLFEFTLKPWGALIGAGVGMIGGAISARGQQKSVKAANEANLKQTQLTNDANLKLFRESRGSDGNAVLPLFFGDSEKGIAKDIIDVYEDGDGVYSTQFGELSKDLVPSISQGNELIGNIQNGKIYDDRKVFNDQKRSARKAAINDSLQETLKKIRGVRNTQGLGGGSSFTDSLLQGATMNARTQAALAGIMDDESLYNDDLNFRLNTLQLPLSRTEGLFNLDRLTNDRRYAPIDSALSRLQFFNLGQGQAPTQQPFFRDAVPNSQMAIGSAVGAAGNAIGDYYSNKKLMDTLNALNQPSTAGSAPAPQATSFNLDLPIRW